VIGNFLKIFGVLIACFNPEGFDIQYSIYFLAFEDFLFLLG